MLRLLIRKKSNPLKLGRWNTVIQNNNDNYKNYIDKNIDWANHDHCGSEICEKYFDNYSLIDKNGKDNENDKNDKNDEIKNWTKYLKQKKK